MPCVVADMFSEASSFNQPLPFDTSRVTNMEYIFYGASSFNQPLPWDTSSITSMACELPRPVRSAHVVAIPLSLPALSTEDQLIAALADPALPAISLASGEYELTTQLLIGRDVTLEAEEWGTVILRGSGTNRIFFISSGRVELRGLQMTAGRAISRRALTSEGANGAQLLTALGVIPPLHRMPSSSSRAFTPLRSRVGWRDNSNRPHPLRWRERSHLSPQGGGVSVWGGELTLTNCSLYSNQAEQQVAPRTACPPDRDVQISLCSGPHCCPQSFNGPMALLTLASASQGGGVHVGQAASSALIQHTHFAENTAKGSGGAIYADSSSGARASVLFSSFDGNSAGVGSDNIGARGGLVCSMPAVPSSDGVSSCEQPVAPPEVGRAEREAEIVTAA
ncbi:MAG: hypothetical protein SGPRY_011799, partial [Prymnesium sp.]